MGTQVRPKYSLENEMFEGPWEEEGGLWRKDHAIWAILRELPVISSLNSKYWRTGLEERLENNPVSSLGQARTRWTEKSNFFVWVALTKRSGFSVRRVAR